MSLYEKLATAGILIGFALACVYLLCNLDAHHKRMLLEDEQIGVDADARPSTADVPVAVLARVLTANVDADTYYRGDDAA